VGFNVTSPIAVEVNEQASTQFKYIVTQRATEKDDYQACEMDSEEFVRMFVKRGVKKGEKDGSGIIGAIFKPHSRLEQKNIEMVTALILDIDGKFKRNGETVVEPVDPDDLFRQLPYRGVAHSSHSHTPELPKFRIILPLNRPITIQEHRRLWVWAYDKVQRKADPACKNADRMFYLPRAPEAAVTVGTPWVRELHGPLLGIEAVPADFLMDSEPENVISFRAKTGHHLAPPETRFAHTDGHLLFEKFMELPIVRWATEHASEVSREVWRGVATNLAAIALEDESDDILYEVCLAAFHKISEEDSDRYSQGDTNQIFADAMKSARSPGPMTFAHMARNGAPDAVCLYEEKTPIGAARTKVRREGSGPGAELPSGSTSAAGDPISALEERKRKLQELDTIIGEFKKHAAEDAAGAIVKARADKTVLAAIGKFIAEDGGGFANVRDSLREKGVTKEKLKELTVLAEEEWGKFEAANEPIEDAAGAGDGKPVGLYIKTNKQFAPMCEEGRQALVNANIPPTLFLRDNKIVRIVKGDKGPKIENLDPASLTDELSLAIEWYQVKVEYDPATPKVPPKEIYYNTYPPERAVNTILSTPPGGLPRLRGVITTPFFDKEGNLVLSPGYHEKAKMFLEEDPKLTVPPVPPAPTEGEAFAAKALLDEMVFDFPFVAAADKANFMALLLEPFAKPMIFGRSPLHVLEAPEAGSGKGLLGDTCARVATGEEMPWRPLPVNEEEREKAILARLLTGGPFVPFDNAKGTIDSPALESVLTTRHYSGRYLGKSMDVQVENNASWLMALNNGQLSRDLGRRAVRTRIDAKVARPETRTGYKHPRLDRWVIDNRAALVHAVLLLIQNWIAKGKPAFSGKPKASFESWSEVIGGIVETSGWSGFLDEKTEEAMVSTDHKRLEAEEFVRAWWEKFYDKEVSAKELLRLAAPPEFYKDGHDEVKERPPREPTYLSGPLGGGAVGTRVNRMGIWLTGNLDRVLAGVRIVLGRADKKNGVNRYKLESVEADAMKELEVWKAKMDEEEATKAKAEQEQKAAEARWEKNHSHDFTGPKTHA
jgi:hypothetical protein